MNGMPNAEGGMPKGPEGRTRLRAGRYTASMWGPQGAILEFGIDLAGRAPFTGARDDEFLEELLVLNAVISGWICGELERLRMASAAHVIAPFEHGGVYRGWQCACGMCSSTGDAARDEAVLRQHVKEVQA